MRPLSKLPFFVVIFTFLLGAANAFAGIREADDSIVDSRTHKFLNLLSDNLGTENTEFSKDHALVALTVSGCNFKILVVGPIAGDAKAYARAVDEWRAGQGLKGDVDWSQEDDCAAVNFSYRATGIGATSGVTNIDLPSLRAALIRLERKTEFVVGDAAWSKVDLGFAPNYTTPQGTRYWNLTEARADLRPIVGRIDLPSWMPVLMAFWFLLPILGVLVTFGLGVWFAKNERIPLPQRRKLYGKSVTGGTYGVLGVHGLLVAITLPTRMFEPMAQLWFGQRFTQLAIPIVPLFVFVPMLALPLMNRVEAKLLGPSDEEKLRREEAAVPTRPVTTVPKGWFARYTWVFLVVGVTIMGIQFLLPKTVTYRSLFSPLGLLVMFLPNFFSLRVRELPKLIVEPELIDVLGAKLRDRVESVAMQMGMAPPPSRVLTEAIYGRFAAVLDKNGVGITVGALESLTDGEIDFLVAHELAHEKLGHLKRRRNTVIAMTSFLFLPVLIFLILGKQLISTPGFAFTPMMIPIVLTVPFSMLSRRSMRQQEFAADRMAIETTGDVETARSALRKVTLNSESPGVHDMDMSSHPTVSARLAAMGSA